MSDPPQNAKGIFLAALDIADAAERAAFVERSCNEAPALRQRVEDLLRAYGQPSGPLDKLAAALALTKFTEPAREQAGTMIGRYKLIELIGEGAMGSVWMAQQTEPVKRLVAIKLIKAGADSKTVLTRFEAERQALALMDHPNIAKVFDGGVSDSGSPFFAMELVKGVPITRYCDDRKLTPRERLALFVPVCQAVQHAHQKGVIHRDLKPTNVLVTQYDGRPVPKVIDFGVAKAVGQPLTEKTLVTGFGAIVGTPAYMSPEQAELNQLDIDTRSDIYALGVLLYEILTGSTPFGKEELEQAGLLEILRVIREQDPPRPSTKLSTANALPTIAANRGTEPKTLTGILRSELDWIVMKALEKDRNRRYETANSFAADIERYLAGEAVQAHPPTAAYRLRKFSHKHRKAIVALAAVAVALIVGIAGTTWGLLRARQAEGVAKASERAAVQAEGKAESAFAQATRERDARDVALKAEAEQRERAERLLAQGLLRPIGFPEYGFDTGREEMGSPELRSLVDWSAIEDSSLKLRVIEVAFEKPEVALRIARRSDLVIQSCVGLSPSRHNQAVRLVSEKQREMSADPRVRIAACSLAIELGSTDLPAWMESYNYHPSNMELLRSMRFVRTAADCRDPKQIAQFKLDPFTEVLAKSSGVLRRREAYASLLALTPRCNATQFDDGSQLVFTFSEPLLDPDLVGGQSSTLALVVERLNPSQVRRAANTVLSTIENSTENVCSGANHALAALAPRLDPSEIQRAGNIEIKILSQQPYQCRYLAAIASKLGLPQTHRAGDLLIAILRRPGEPLLWYYALKCLNPMCAHLEPRQVTELYERVVSLAKSPEAWSKDLDGWSGIYPGRILEALAPRLTQKQATDAWHVLSAIPRNPSEESRALWIVWQPRDMAGGLQALASRLEAIEVNATGDAIVAALENSNVPVAKKLLSVEQLVVLSARLQPAHVKRAADALIKTLEDEPFGFGINNAALSGLSALESRLDSIQISRAAEALIKITSTLNGTTENASPNLAQGFRAILPRMEPSQIVRAGTAIFSFLEEKIDPYFRERMEIRRAELLAALAPRLEPKQALRGGESLMAMLEREGGLHVLRAADRALSAASARLDPVDRDRFATTATKFMLDCCISFDPLDEDLGNGSATLSIVDSMSNPKSVARFLSHPGCVGGLRESLLRRFDELVCNRGERLILKRQSSGDARVGTDEPAPGRLQNIHEAANWIKNNWSDWNLDRCEAVNWLGSNRSPVHVRPAQ